MQIKYLRELNHSLVYLKAKDKETLQSISNIQIQLMEVLAKIRDTYLSMLMDQDSFLENQEQAHQEQLLEYILKNSAMIQIKMLLSLLK